MVPVIAYVRARRTLWSAVGLMVGLILIGWNVWIAATTYLPQYAVRNDLRLAYGAALVGIRDGYGRLYDLGAQRIAVESLGPGFNPQPFISPPPLAWLVTPLLPLAIAAYQEKLAARLREALASNDEERIRQEIAMFGIKVDVAEELNRLAAHLQEVRRVLDAGGAAGKRLDFLMQELNREANTLGSKSVSKEVSEAAIELKLLIEQMREQIQNIE